jgi:predicted acetyltransferase
MSVEIRAITADEAVRYRRAVRAGFLSAHTIDDETHAREFRQPHDRALAAFDGDDIVATLASFPSELTVPGGAAVDVGAVTAVTCRVTHRRRGLLTRMIGQDLAASKERGAVADILIAAEYPIYGRFGYGPAVPSVSWELDLRGDVTFTTPGAGTISFLDNDAFRKEAPPIFERLRRDRAGMKSRDELDWDFSADLRRSPEDKPWQGFRILCTDDAGSAVGYASYTIDEKWADMRPQSAVQVTEMVAATPEAEARLWRFFTEIDLVVAVKASDRPMDDTLPFLLANGRLAKQVTNFDFIWVRPLDVAALLTSRTYATAGRVVIEVVDDQDLAGGRYALDASSAGATCTTTTEAAELTMPIRTLGAACLGGPAITQLHRAGWLDEHVAGAAARASALLAAPTAPWCNTWF